MKQLLFLIMLFIDQVCQAQVYQYNAIKLGQEKQSIHTTVELSVIETGGVMLSIITENDVKYFIKLNYYEEEKNNYI